MINFLGWLGNISFLYGAYAFCIKNIKGFYAQILGNLFYTFQAYYTKNWSLFTLSIILMIINLYGIIRWNSAKKINKNNNAESLWAKQVIDYYNI